VIDRVDAWLDTCDGGDTSLRPPERCPHSQRALRRGRAQASASRETLISPGLDEGVMARLYTTDGRYTGTIHFHPRSRGLPTRATTDALLVMSTALAAVADWLRAPSAIAGSLEPGASVAIVNVQGRVVEVPGRQAGAHLAQGSPLVQTVGSLLHPSTTTSRFLWRDSVSRWHRVRIERLPFGTLVFERETVPPHQLTCREFDVLTLLADGHSNREIAALLVIALKTVASHVEHVLEKLKCSSRTAAAARAVDEGLIRHPLALPGLGRRGGGGSTAVSGLR